MFTGIVEEIGTVRHVGPTTSGSRLEIACARVLDHLSIDDSINVAGGCLTVIDRDDRGFASDVVPETIARTTLGALLRGSRVNLERAATPETALGGHLVQGDLTMAAQACTPQTVAFIRKYASGVICVPMTSERLEQLDLPQMVQRNEARLGTAFTVSVDAREDITTGISATDRAHTIRVLADPNSRPGDLVKPGH